LTTTTTTTDFPSVTDAAAAVITCGQAFIILQKLKCHAALWWLLVLG
jgi:hypothetical protein